MDSRPFLICAALALSQPAFAQDHAQHQPPGAEDPHAGHDPAEMDDAAHRAHGLHGALGGYAMAREASGTSWQPDASPHAMSHYMRGEWALSGHVMLNGVYASMGGPRGDDQAFVAGMIMAAARRDFDRGTLNIRAMLSPDPFMGEEGYPLLLAAGETADGVEPLVDRQHPHDLFMELSLSYAHQLSDADSVFVYLGLPGEPAFGPPAFMHRMSAMDSPEAPITHHWLDSTHITFGVVTAGWVHRAFKIEVSQFRGREPDEYRYDIETGELDSTAVRLSWNPNENWSLQASWADVTSPEQLEPDEDEARFSASAIYAGRFGGGGWWSVTAAFARKERSDGVTLDAWLAEAAVSPHPAWTLFARGELIETDELGAVHHGPIEEAGRLSFGVIRDLRLTEHAVIGFGALASRHFVSDALDPLYSGDQTGAMAFVRFKVQ